MSEPLTEALSEIAPHHPAEQARALLEAAGVRGITIEGEGESWRVSVGWNAHERFVVAFSEKNAETANDPVFLAGEALAALIRNEGPCPHVAEVTEVSRETPAPETDALWSPDDEAPDLGAELLEVQDEEGQDSGDDGDAGHPDSSSDDDADRGGGISLDRAEGDGHDQPDLSPLGDEDGRDGSVGDHGYPGIAVLPDDLSVALALVIEAVASQEEARVAAVEDLQAADLQHQIDYGNWPAGTKIPDYIEAGAKRWQSLSQQRAAIQAHSLALRRSARDHRARGDLSALQGMADGVGDGWP